MENRVKIIECPRDAWQGMTNYIPVDVKANYIQTLLSAGFDTIDFGSFVSPKAIPQMRDTAELIKLLDLSKTATKLLAIVANVRGAEDALCFEEIDYLGFPLSLSETFQKRNTNKSIAEAKLTVEKIQSACVKKNKQLVIYLSMGFGNPYGDVWNIDLVYKFSSAIKDLGIQIISLSDTVGTAKPTDIRQLFSELLKENEKDIEFGAHLHTRADNWLENTNAAWEGGCRRFDSAINGFGGCPMAEDRLTGNLSTQNLLAFLNNHNGKSNLDENVMKNVLFVANSIFIA